MFETGMLQSNRNQDCLPFVGGKSQKNTGAHGTHASTTRKHCATQYFGQPLLIS